MRGGFRDRAPPAALAALLFFAFAGGGCSTEAVIIGSDSTDPVPLGVGIAGRDTSGVDPNKFVKDLSAEEAHAWCDWFSRVFPLAGAATPADSTIDEDGLVFGYGAIGCDTIHVCTEHLSVHHCVANLAIQPCEATLAELDSCVGVMWGLCMFPEHCEPFLAAPSCLGTIVGALGDPGVHPMCPIRAE